MNQKSIIRLLAVSIAAGLLLGVSPLGAQLTEDEKNTIDVVKKTKNSVVFVVNIQRVQDLFFFEQEVPRGSGSGFIWDDRGHIVTNFHVTEEGDKFSVSLPNQEQRQAKLIGYDPAKDIAVLKVDGDLKGLQPVTAGTSKDLQVGQKVIAVGNPFGFDHTVTKGIVSALGRKILGAGGVSIQDMIQTDASINPGNSGGPLLNSSGELIGMNTMIISPSGASSGVGFAIPVDTIKKIVPEIIDHGKVIRPEIPVDFLSDEYARQARVEGAVILKVPRGGPAAAAGLRGIERDEWGRRYITDVITGIDELKIRSYDELYNALENRQIGDTVTLAVSRNGKERKVRIKLVGS